MPVTSVEAWAPKVRMSSAAWRFRRAMEASAASYAARTASGVVADAMVAHLVGLVVSHWYAFTATCVPSGLVSTSTSPALAW